MESESSCSLFSKSKPQRTYDVFINFRGEDTRRKFVSHLHHGLSTNAGVKTFWDEESLAKGTPLGELMRAIEGSQIALVVFSQTYTQSRWCLRELEKIIECHKNYGQIVLPVFYHVDPSDVSHQNGDFGEALKATAQKTVSEDGDAFLRWSHALNEAAEFCGWDVRNYRNEAQLVKDIVEDVLSKLEYDALSITDFPVGLESRVQQVIRFIENQCPEVCKLGIWGMGGSGKTTTAKVIYNRIHHRFMHKSFMEGIREFCVTDRRGQLHLQEQLLSDILKEKVMLHSLGRGKTVIDNRLAGKTALIVLDDVDKYEQLQDLCGNCKWFGQGTVIIITTRNLRLLEQFKVDYLYEMHKMDEEESLELFSWHAFGEAKPRQDFNELARNAVAYCGGLPLALEILGSYLSERTEKEWKSVLSKRKIIPDAKVQKILKISYKGLCDMNKNIFLDVCCVFIGEDRDYVIEILNGCDRKLFADIGITELTQHSLIKVEKNNKLGVHPLLRDMGREIIRKSSCSRKEPGKHSRLWFHEDVLNVLTNNTGTEVIEGLALKLPLTNTVFFEAVAFKEMNKLRLLRLDYVQLGGDYGYLSKELRWIYWQGFPLEHMPNNFNLEGVIAIHFKHSNLRQVWKEPKVLSRLKFLNLSHSKYLTETPDFSKLPNLKKLILKHCRSLCKIHQSLGDLSFLELINLKGCSSLSNLPRETYQLKSVKTLILSGCLKIDKLEEDIGRMESLTTLIAENTAVEKVPFSIVSSKSIGYIFLCGFKGSPHNVFPSIIWSWISPTINPLSYISPFCGVSSSLVSMNMKKNELGALTPILSSILNLRSVLVQCDTELQTSKQVETILDEVRGVNLIKSEIAPYISEISEHSLRSFFIRIGSCQDEVFNTLSQSISEELTTSESCNDFVPGNKYPYWLAHTGNERSVYFTVPDDCSMNGMTLCVVYLSAPENTATDCLASVIMVNHTKCTIQIYKRDTAIFFNEVDWQGIMSHLESGDHVEFYVTFTNGLVVKKSIVYLMYDESTDMNGRGI
ncbi:TMV resistance protein N [Cajanus cajan]|uniref:TMV resistance protein N n=1 Tax=Cajanus cajan TaxID=3821 RepID=A0A151R1T6_CAJCA|nr:TMV resistance protein N [Cajanus cajan]XP_020205484.1 TMV resistance protein N [Cajanus cajan]KYP36527.1 TMV resistance protein N [Cajanus cajan]